MKGKIFNAQEVQVIRDYYGTKKAKRSGVLLINHIYEGLLVLDALEAPFICYQAFCLHPIVQNNINIDLSWSSALGLAREYALKANSYLCRLENDWVKTIDDVYKIVGDMSSECKLMLLADKYQNRKDFNLYHAESHARAKELSQYFDLWLKFLKSKLLK